MRFELVKGTRDFGWEKQRIREKIIETIKNEFEIYGFRQIETSILDFYKIAASKYVGEEIIKEIYRLRDRANRDLCLRYELTFKLAKYISMDQPRMPFKRYEIGKVFRDGPVKKGRLREFTQADADIVGVKSLIADAELMALAFSILKKLNLNAIAKFNSKKLLYGLLASCEIKKELFSQIALTLDKLEKIGKAEVIKELGNKIGRKKALRLFEIFDETEKLKLEAKLNFFGNFKNNEIKNGLKEIEEFIDFCKSFGINLNKFEFVPYLARGLSYYTGLMWEFYVKPYKNSIIAGGRWDELIGKFLNSKTNIYATGISLGIDSLYYAIEELKIKISKKTIPKVLVIPIKKLKEAIKILQELRNYNISCDFSYEERLKKALDYANKQKIRYCLLIGEKEINENRLRLRDMEKGEEKLLKLKEIVEEISNK